MPNQFPLCPYTKEMSDLIRSAANKRGRPNHFVSDKGPQFTSDHFRATLKRLGIKQRFGAICKYGSISIIERFWRTLKDLLVLRSRRAWGPLNSCGDSMLDCITTLFTSRIKG